MQTSMVQNVEELSLTLKNKPLINNDKETLESGLLTNIIYSTITVYHPPKPNGLAVIMCPGGGFTRLAVNSEGHNMASWFITEGITYIVLKYRMPGGNFNIPFDDAKQAIVLVRKLAKKWNVRPDRVGIMGASAGGFLAAFLATQYNNSDILPDFQVLLYPVISLAEEFISSKFSEICIGKGGELKEKYSLEKQVSEKSPQAFIAVSADDNIVSPTNSISYFLALLKHNVSASLHVYPTGGHAWGFSDNFVYKREWTDELGKWFREGLIFND